MAKSPGLGPLVWFDCFARAEKEGVADSMDYTAPILDCSGIDRQRSDIPNFQERLAEKETAVLTHLVASDSVALNWRKGTVSPVFPSCDIDCWKDCIV
jgi:hypothetical protein